MAKKPGNDKILFRGPEGFQAWYSQELGPRWEQVHQACLQQHRHMALGRGLVRPYYLDPASVLAALSLGVRPGMAVLDLCAAPGGKSLVLALGLAGLIPETGLLSGLEAGSKEDQPTPAADPGGPGVFGGGCLWANERSATRRGRLREVLNHHLPPEIASRIKISGHDAGRWGQHQENAWDRILLDVPCSSERHLLENPQHLKDWSPRRSAFLAQQAYAMVLSAATALKPGGRLVYSTCAFSPLENDQVVQRAVGRLESARGFTLVSVPWESGDLALLGAEATRWGRQIWPDTGGGRGPLYFALLEKPDKEA